MDDRFTALPPGRHRLSREQVESSQRGRMLLAIATVVAEKGYQRATVADVLRRARVSRDTFYQYFRDKEACFLTALQQGADALSGIIEDSVEHEVDAAAGERFERILRVYLAALAAEPTLTRVFFLESYAAGESAWQARFAVQEQFTRTIAANFADDESWSTLPEPEFASRMLVGAISSLVTATVAADQTEALPGLSEPILDLLHSLKDRRSNRATGAE